MSECECVCVCVWVVMGSVGGGRANKKCALKGEVCVCGWVRGEALHYNVPRCEWVVMGSVGGARMRITL